MSEFPFFLRLNIFYYMHIPHFSFPFVYWRPLGLFPAFGYGEYGDAAVNVGVQVSSRPCPRFLHVHTQKWNCWSYGNSMFNILKNCHPVLLFLLFLPDKRAEAPSALSTSRELLDWMRLLEVEWLAPGSTTGGDERVRSEQIQTQRRKALYLQAVPAPWEAWLSSFWEESHPLFPLPSLWGGSRGYGLYGDPQPCAPIICKVPNDSCDS